MIKVLKTGFYSTIQDLGRFGCQEYGIPFSGVMDSFSAKLANNMLGNKDNDAVIEMTMTGDTLLFNCNTTICVTGANMSPMLNGISFSNNKIIQVKKDDVLSFGELEYGFRSYLAVLGGFQTENVFNSRSMYENITARKRLANGDELDILKLDKSDETSNASIKINTNHFTSETIEVFKGAEFNQLTKEEQNLLETMLFSISKENNRMAYTLNENFNNDLKSIITSLVLPGTVQLTPSGKLIVLMRDCQTTGGYPRVLQLSEASINKLSQKYTGNSIQFKLIDY